MKKESYAAFDHKCKQCSRKGHQLVLSHKPISLQVHQDRPLDPILTLAEPVYIFPVPNDDNGEEFLDNMGKLSAALYTLLVAVPNDDNDEDFLDNMKPRFDANS